MTTHSLTLICYLILEAILFGLALWLIPLPSPHYLRPKGTWKATTPLAAASDPEIQLSF
jgi:hypothetical protein